MTKSTGATDNGLREVKRTLWVEDGKIQIASDYSDGTKAIAVCAPELIEIEFAPDGRISVWSKTLEDPRPRRRGRVRL